MQGMSQWRVAWTSVALAAALLLAGCTPSADERGRVTLRVFAAASLKASFTQIAQQFEAEHRGVSVALNFAGSADLLAQIQHGAPADVFASADQRTMRSAEVDNLLHGGPVPFASNTLRIVVPPGNSGGVESLRDLTRPGLNVVVCAPVVPCGAATVAAQSAAGVVIEPVSEEQSVADVLAKVTSGQADAGLVYLTDAKAAEDAVSSVDFAESASAVNTYPIAVVGSSQHSSVATDFVEYVRSNVGRQVLRDAGFGAP
jgi:molybdate transport system substrate-binding protein